MRKQLLHSVVMYLFVLQQEMLNIELTELAFALYLNGTTD